MSKAVYRHHRLIVTALIVLATVLGKTAPSFAQSDRAQGIRIIVGFAPGGGVDLVARLIAQDLNSNFGASAVVENISGAGGNIAAVTVAKAPANGRTLLFVSSAHTMNAALDAGIPYDPIRDFAPITEVVKGVSVIAVHPSLGVKSLVQFVALAKQKPGQLFYGSGGTGTISHMAAELLKSYAKIDVTHVPYKGAGPYTAAMLSGEVQLAVTGLSTSLPHIRSGKLIALAVTTRQRVDSLPEIPTADEAGVPGYEYGFWSGFFAPAGTPSAIVQRFRDQVAAAIATPGLAARLKSDGYIPVGSTPQEFAALVKTDLQTWTVLVKNMGIKAQ